MMHGSKVWDLNAEDMGRLERSETRMPHRSKCICVTEFLYTNRKIRHKRN